jgi:glycosyltransferase involved in cell wall biosynthesis
MTASPQLRLRVVSRIYAPEPSAASQRLLSLVRGLRDAGVQTTVLSARLQKRAGGAAPEPHPGVARVRVLRDSAGYVRGYLPYLSFDVQAAMRVLLGRRTDAIVIEPPPTTGLLVGVAARLRRIPYVYYAADIWSDASAQTSAHPLVVRVVRWMESLAIRGASGVLAVTEQVSERVGELAPAASVTVVGHGVDMDVYTPRIDPETDGPVDLVYVGSASEWHGAGVLVDALCMLPAGSVDAILVGQGSEWAAMQEQVREAGLGEHVRMLSTVPSAEAAEWLRRARVSVATLRPGAGYDFAVPTKLYSSVAVGTPVIYAGPDPVRALVNEEQLGWGVEHDVDALAAAIRNALSDGAAEKLRERVAAWARENVSASSVVDRSVAAILRVIPRPTG